MAYVLLLGLNLTRATAHTKVMNFTSNIGSLIIFLLGNHVLFVSGIVMGIGQLLGARLGSRAVIKQGVRLIRPIFITIVVLISLKLLYTSFRTPEVLSAAPGDGRISTCEPAFLPFCSSLLWDTPQASFPLTSRIDSEVAIR